MRALDAFAVVEDHNQRVSSRPERGAGIMPRLGYRSAPSIPPKGTDAMGRSILDGLPEGSYFSKDALRAPIALTIANVQWQILKNSRTGVDEELPVMSALFSAGLPDHDGFEATDQVVSSGAGL